MSGDEGSIGSFKKRFSETTAPREEPHQEEKEKKNLCWICTNGQAKTIAHLSILRLGSYFSNSSSIENFYDHFDQK